MLRMQLHAAHRRCELAGMLEPCPIHKRMPSTLSGQPPASRMGDTCMVTANFRQRKGHCGEEASTWLFCVCVWSFPKKETLGHRTQS